MSWPIAQSKCLPYHASMSDVNRCPSHKTIPSIRMLGKLKQVSFHLIPQKPYLISRNLNFYRDTQSLVPLLPQPVGLFLLAHAGTKKLRNRRKLLIVLARLTAPHSFLIWPKSIKESLYWAWLKRVSTRHWPILWYNNYKAYFFLCIGMFVCFIWGVLLFRKWGGFCSSHRYL